MAMWIAHATNRRPMVAMYSMGEQSWYIKIPQSWSFLKIPQEAFASV